MGKAKLMTNYGNSPNVEEELTKYLQCSLSLFVLRRNSTFISALQAMRITGDSDNYSPLLMCNNNSLW